MLFAGVMNIIHISNLLFTLSGRPWRRTVEFQAGRELVSNLGVGCSVPLWVILFVGIGSYKHRVRDKMVAYAHRRKGGKWRHARTMRTCAE